MEKQRILVVEDDPNVCELVSLYLNREGYQVDCVGNGEEALRAYRAAPPDLIVLDLMLPGLDGLEVCRQVRKESETPIIMLSARGDDIDRILGLELGADDYVPKPFNPRELVARVKAVLRRSRQSSDGRASEQRPLQFTGLTIDPLGRVVVVGEQEIQLTPKEFDLLWHMAIHPGRTFTRPELLEAVWGYDYFGDERTVDVHIKRLRQKIEPPGSSVRYIHTVWGVGYKFLVDEESR